MTRALSVVWAPIVVVALHSALAAAIGHHVSLDPIFHFLGGAAGAYALLQAFARIRWAGRLAMGWNPRLVAVAVTIAFAILWECGEYVVQHYFGTRIQLGPLDTGSDLVLGALGAIAVAWMPKKITVKE